MNPDLLEPRPSNVRPVQYRVINGDTLIRREAEPYAYDLRVHDLGHGHIEAVASPRYAWGELDLLSPVAQAMYAEAVASPVDLSEAEKLDRLVLNRARACRRARTQVRRLAKSKGLTVLLTLTYRENQTDRARMARDFDAFAKRVRRVIPGFEYVCVFERQKRGAWHAHIAVRRLQSVYMRGGVLVKSYTLLRAMWRGVVGADNGNIDVSRNKAVKRSSAKLAAYLSKYIGKTFDQAERYVNTYSASGRALPDAISERVLVSRLSDAMFALLDLVGPEVERSHFHHAVLDGGGYFLCLSPRDRGKAA